MKVKFSLLRGVCQTPAYVALECGLFEKRGLEVSYDIAPTAWMIPERLADQSLHFSVIPWTRVAVDPSLCLLSGSGIEEAALVVRTGMELEQVRKVAVPRQGGMKDLTAMGLIESMGWSEVEILRCPSGDGAILAFLGQGCDAASMIEPYATMCEHLGAGRVVKRTGDLWPGAPGCSLTTSHRLKKEQPELVSKVVEAYVEAAGIVKSDPRTAARAASPYIGISETIIESALSRNKPDIDAVRNQDSMDEILTLMRKLGYIEATPGDYKDLSFLDKCTCSKK